MLQDHIIRKNRPNISDLLQLSIDVSEDTSNWAKFTIFGDIRWNKQFDKWPTTVQQLHTVINQTQLIFIYLWRFKTHSDTSHDVIKGHALNSLTKKPDYMSCN